MQKIILQKYKFYNPFTRSSTSQEVKNTAFLYKANLFCVLVNYDPNKWLYKENQTNFFRIQFRGSFAPPGFKIWLQNSVYLAKIVANSMAAWKWKLYLFLRTIKKKQSFDSFDDFIIQIFGNIKSKSDNRLLKFYTADQKLKIELFSNFCSAILDPPSWIWKFCFQIWIQHPQKLKNIHVYKNLYNNFQTVNLAYWIPILNFAILLSDLDSVILKGLRYSFSRLAKI